MVSSCFRLLNALRAQGRFSIALTRHGVLVAARTMQGHRAYPPFTKTVMVLTGSTLIGLGVSLFLHARLGLPPYDVFVSSVAMRSGLSHGQTAWVVSAVLFALAALLRRPPSRYGILFMAANGLSIDAWRSLILDPSSLATRVVFIVLGTAAIAAGVAVVAHSGSTGGPFELLSLAASDRGLSQTATRSILELSIVAGGLTLGGNAGIGTVVFALTIGPLISLGFQALADRQSGREQRVSVRS